ncbi:hypothetical protein MNBD_GAMMA09-1291 [hydrothermal vent metagenome]|uniref:Dirigent protein n=1 Tax=hydrothermal vent metagenome TaxID=652676 RepID=A0A3B0XLX3_9ZZZZ
MNKWLLFIITGVILLAGCNRQSEQTMFTIADARDQPAVWIDIEKKGDSVGDVLTFDQPLLDKKNKKIGNNSGFCIRTRIAHSFQCQWTLQFSDGSIQVAGREFDKRISTLSIVGGSGKYSGVRGEMKSTNNNDGTFSQVLFYRYYR